MLLCYKPSPPTEIAVDREVMLQFYCREEVSFGLFDMKELISNFLSRQ